MLDERDWLPQAKSLAVGMRAKFRHLHERRPNMTVGNEQGRWWAYCQACKEGGVIQKDHVLLGHAEVPVEPHEMCVPPDLRPVLGGEFEVTVGRFLASKGMDPVMLPKLWLSESRRRLCFQDWIGNWHGRDLTDKSAAKWLHYSKQRIVGEPWGHTTIVTEDLFSMFKVRYALGHTTGDYARWAMGVRVVTTLGSGCDHSAALALKHCRQIVWAYDGDKAGDAGYIQAAKRMRAFGSKQFRARPPEGLDPKDMTCEDIRTMIKVALQ